MIFVFSFLFLALGTYTPEGVKIKNKILIIIIQFVTRQVPVRRGFTVVLLNTDAIGMLAFTKFTKYGVILCWTTPPKDGPK